MVSQLFFICGLIVKSFSFSPHNISDLLDLSYFSCQPGSQKSSSYLRNHFSTLSALVKLIFNILISPSLAFLQKKPTEKESGVATARDGKCQEQHCDPALLSPSPARLGPGWGPTPPASHTAVASLKGSISPRRGAHNQTPNTLFPLAGARKLSSVGRRAAVPSCQRSTPIHRTLYHSCNRGQADSMVDSAVLPGLKDTAKAGRSYWE